MSFSVGESGDKQTSVNTSLHIQEEKWFEIWIWFVIGGGGVSIAYGIKKVRQFYLSKAVNFFRVFPCQLVLFYNKRQISRWVTF